jgi:hypothetical protein
MNFSRNLYATMLIAVFGAMVLAGTGADQTLANVLHDDTGGGAAAFARVFFTAAASMSVALIAIIVMQEKPLQTGAELDA